MQIYIDIDSTLEDIITPFFKQFKGGKYKLSKLTSFANIDNVIEPGTLAALIDFCENQQDKYDEYPNAISMLKMIRHWWPKDIIVYSSRTPKARQNFTDKYGIQVVPKSDIIMSPLETNILIDDYPPLPFVGYASMIYLIDQPWNKDWKDLRSLFNCGLVRVDSFVSAAKHLANLRTGWTTWS